MTSKKLIDEITSKFVNLIAQGKTHEQVYDILVLQGYRKSEVDLCVIDAVVWSTDLFNEINLMANSGLTPKEVVKYLQEKGYSEAVIRSHMEQFLNPQ